MTNPIEQKENNYGVSGSIMSDNKILPGKIEEDRRKETIQNKKNTFL